MVGGLAKRDHVTLKPQVADRYTSILVGPKEIRSVIEYTVPASGVADPDEMWYRSIYLRPSGYRQMRQE